MPGDLGRVRRGPPITADPPDILEAVDDGRKGGRILRDGVSGRARSSPGTWTYPRRHTPCAGPGRSNIGPPPSRPLAAEADCLKSGGNCATTFPKSVEEVVEGDGGCDPEI